MFEYPLSECTFQVSSSDARFVVFRFVAGIYLFFSSHDLGLRHRFQLALPEHGDDTDVCGDSEHSEPREFNSDPVSTSQGNDSSHSGVSGVFSNPSGRY